MDTPAQIIEAMVRLRRIQADVLAPMPQNQIVDAVGRWAALWQGPDFSFRREAELLTEPFPFPHVQVSLDGLLPSLAAPALDALIDAEHVRDALGVPLIGHVIAGNTPLLAWVSLLRALLMRSASFAKLPSGPTAQWAQLFVRSLACVSPALASTITLAEWPGGTPALDDTLCAHADLVMCQGGDNAIASLRARTPPATPFIGYGHALSFGLLLDNADWDTAAEGFARDILVYAQGGCLSVKTILLLGDPAHAARFAQHLTLALRLANATYPAPPATPQDWGQHNTARLLGQLQPDASCPSAPSDPFVVLVWPRSEFHVQPGTNVVTVQALSPRARLDTLLAPLAGQLQGCALAGTPTKTMRAALETLGISRLCPPGAMQAPPFAWRQNGRDVLRVLCANTKPPALLPAMEALRYAVWRLCDTQ